MNKDFLFDVYISTCNSRLYENVIWCVHITKVYSKGGRDKTKSVWISDDREYYKYLVYIIDVDITTLCVEGNDNSHWIYSNKYKFHLPQAFNNMNELLRKECDVSCNFIFLSNCMTKWFLHSLGIIYWRGFELLFFYFFAAVLLLPNAITLFTSSLVKCWFGVYRHTLEWFKDNLINENQDGSRLFHIYSMW